MSVDYCACEPVAWFERVYSNTIIYITCLLICDYLSGVTGIISLCVFCMFQFIIWINPIVPHVRGIVYLLIFTYA